jgi:hypothetical protein
MGNQFHVEYPQNLPDLLCHQYRAVAIFDISMPEAINRMQSNGMG